MKKPVHIIAGPTGSGKSTLAIERARAAGGAVINVDSRQIYDALPILTAQPSAEEKEQAPHYLYGELHPNDACSAGNWREMAMPLIERLLADGIIPVITGGTGLYIKALIEGLPPIPDVPTAIRAEAVKRQEELGNPAFYEELQRRDPQTAALYHPMHTARLVHAWEILEATGKPLAQWQAMPKKAPPEDWAFDVTILMPDRGTLNERCDKRFHAMMAAGAAEELAAFDAQTEAGLISPQSIMHKTIGAKPLRAWRDGHISRDEAVMLAQLETRQYAKRQSTWFRNQIKPRENIAAITILS
ncbi:MAG: tRNA (adenosine(37)-N6)-dimethylallyltransferase MiaA [Micavibrio sp.]